MSEDPGLRSYTLTIPDVYVAAGTSPDGLTTAEAKVRLAKFGSNAIQTIKGKPMWRKLLANFTHLMALLLWAGGAMAFVGKVDCVLLVAAAETTTIQEVDVCERDLASQTNVLGVVLNKCRYLDRKYGYSYYG